MKQLVQRRYIYFTISLLVIGAGLYFLLLHPLVTGQGFRIGLVPGIDFTGGALWSLDLPGRQPEQVSTNDVASAFAEAGFENARVQISPPTRDDLTGTVLLVRTRALSETDPNAERQAVLDALSSRYGQVLEIQRESVSATVSQQSTVTAFWAVVFASVAILVYLTIAFRTAPNPIRYGVCVILAMLHDVLLVLGVAAILGAVAGLEVDALFLTALLTVISFSVQDKIVVFDRIRENLARPHTREQFNELVNLSIAQVMPRSICTQLTSLFTLTALLLFGGATTREFVLMMLIGLVCGTYSSMFIAAQLLVVWENREWRTWFGRGRGETPAPA